MLGCKVLSDFQCICKNMIERSGFFLLISNAGHVCKDECKWLGVWVNCYNFMKNECEYDELWFRINLHENWISLRKILSEVMQNKG